MSISRIEVNRSNCKVYYDEKWIDDELNKLGGAYFDMLSKFQPVDVRASIKEALKAVVPNGQFFQSNNIYKFGDKILVKLECEPLEVNITSNLGEAIFDFEK